MAASQNAIVEVDRRRGLLDDISPAVAALLDAWADWVGRYGDGLGYGSTSVAWRLMESKRTGVASRGTATEPEMPASLAAVDRAIGTLDGPERKALRTYYLWYAPVEDKARRCRCSVSEFYRRLRDGRRHVAKSVQTDEISA